MPAGDAKILCLFSKKWLADYPDELAPIVTAFVESDESADRIEARMERKFRPGMLRHIVESDFSHGPRYQLIDGTAHFYQYLTIDDLGRRKVQIPVLPE